MDRLWCKAGRQGEALGGCEGRALREGAVWKNLLSIGVAAANDSQDSGEERSGLLPKASVCVGDWGSENSEHITKQVVHKASKARQLLMDFRTLSLLH